MDWIKRFWDAIDLGKLLAIMIVATWLATILLKYQIDETLKNVVLVIAGFLWGSSMSSRKKDDALIAQMPAPTAPVPPAQG